MAWNDNLRGEALAIAESDESVIRVIAGPGSGKTFTLMRRIARLLEEGVNPKKILLVTFTKTAAHDLQKGLSELKVKGADKIWAGTLHSYCFSMLQQEGVFKITKRNPRPLFKFEEDFLVADLSVRSNMGKKDVRKKINAFEAAWARLQSEEAGWPKNSDDKDFQKALFEYLKFHKGILLGELITVMFRYLKSNPKAPERNQFDYVFVDEYQDLNKAEQKLIDYLAGDRNFMIIGDEDQSIYQNFRHANPEGILEFHKDHPTTVDFALTICRRCPQTIVRIADTFIKNNELRNKGKTLKPRSKNPEGNIYAVQWNDMQSEAEGIASYIVKKIDDGINAGDILILCPRRQFGYNIRDALSKMGVAAHSFFQEQTLEDADAQKALTFLNLLANRKDNVALRAWIGFDSSTRSAPAYRRIFNYCLDNDLDLSEVLKRLSTKKLDLPHCGKIADKYSELLEKLDEFKDFKGQEIRDHLFPIDEEWADPFQALLKDISENSIPEQILEIIRSSIINPSMPTDVDYVRIMSLHKSKGLTARIVVITGFIESLIPKGEDGLPPKEEKIYREEERRLCYVGLTRATDELVISSVYNLPRGLALQMRARVISNSGNTTTITSSFVEEFGEEFPDLIDGEELLDHE